MSVTVYRVQDGLGRGPFKPGMTKRWIRQPRTFLEQQHRLRNFPDLITDFGPEALKKACRIAGNRHIGCACASLRELDYWFRPDEMIRLLEIGYFVVALDADEVLIRSKSQLLFCRTLPFSEGYRRIR